MITIITLLSILAISPILHGAEDARKVPFRNRKIISFIEINMGKKVGDGDCWDLGHHALKAAGGEHPKGKNLLWGKEINFDKDEALPGDIIQTFAKGKAPDGKHTAIIYQVHEGGEVTIAEQNFNKKLFVTTRKVNLRKLADTKELHVYRPRG